MEHDPFVSCPYNPIHRVPRSRLQGHIVKCEKQYPKLEICPYNATHRYPESEIKNHILNCPSKLAIFPEQKVLPKPRAMMAPKPMLTKEYLDKNDPDYEDWD